MSSTYTAFFYGTLMHPKILTRVIANDGEHLEICPALLMNHTRHRVKYAEYPGVVPFEQARQLLAKDLPPEERCVRGTLVKNLTLRDIGRLDRFEGDQYERLPVTVHPLGHFKPVKADSKDVSSMIPDHATPIPLPSELPEAIPAQTYIFQDVRSLDPQPWSWDDFVQKNAWKWYGGNPETTSSNQDQVEGNLVEESGSSCHSATVPSTYSEEWGADYPHRIATPPNPWKDG